MAPSSSSGMSAPSGPPPGTDYSNSAANDPLIQRRIAKKQAKEEYKEQKAAAKQEYKQDLKEAKQEYKQEKREANAELKR